MANIPNSIPFVFNMDPHPFYNPETYPNNMYSRLHPRQYQNPIDINTMGLITALAPHIRQLDGHGKIKDDLAHVPSKGLVQDKDHDFHIHLDVGLFAPEEITVKIVDDHIIIEGKHEERKAHDVGFVSRHFIRRYELPKGYNPDAVVSKLSADGVLSVMLPKPTDKPKERIVNIQYGGPSDIFLKKVKPIKGDKTDKTITKNGVEEETKG